MEKKIVYVEPADYFPKEIRKKYKLGEFAETQEDTMKTEDAEGMESPSESSDKQQEVKMLVLEKLILMNC